MLRRSALHFVQSRTDFFSSLLVTTYEYDAAGNVRFVTDPRGNTTETRYDVHGRPTTVVFPATDEHPATEAVTTYNALGQRIAATDQEGRLTRYRYDGLGRLVEVRQYLDQSLAADDANFSLPPSHSGIVSTRYTYDELGNQLTQTDARGHTTSYRHDNLGRRLKRTLPDHAFESLQYDEWGNLWKRTDFKGYTTTFLYDVRHRLTEKRADPLHPSLIYPHAPDKITYGYDAAGNRTDATVEKGTAVLYVEGTPVDERNRRAYKDTALGRLTYSYHDNGLLKTVSSSNASGVNIAYRYDEANRLAFVDDRSGASSNAPARTTSYTYNANGLLETISTPNGVRHSYVYDALNRLRNLAVTNIAPGSPLLRGYTCELNPTGHRRKIIESTGRTADYGYDSLYRLTSETITGGASGTNGAVSYTLDKVGNREARASQIANLSSQAGLSYNSRDWLNTDTYDANGNTLTSPHTTYGAPLTVADVFDFEDRLIIRRKPDGTTINLSYDADGIRRQKTIFNAASQFVSATGHLVDTNNHTGYAQVFEEYRNTAAGTTTLTYTYGSDLISVVRVDPNAQSTTRYFGYDGLASVRLLTNATGAITDTWDYDAFGNELTRTGTTDNAYLYRGEQFDTDLGHYYLRARFYNQATGRFWNKDSFEGSGADPISLHKYLYGNSNPIRFFDPSGQFSIMQFMGTALLPTLARQTLMFRTGVGAVLSAYDIGLAYSVYYQTILAMYHFVSDPRGILRVHERISAMHLLELSLEKYKALLVGSSVRFYTIHLGIIGNGILSAGVKAFKGDWAKTIPVLGTLLEIYEGYLFVENIINWTATTVSFLPARSLTGRLNPTNIITDYLFLQLRPAPIVDALYDYLAAERVGDGQEKSAASRNLRAVTDRYFVP